MSEIQNRPLIVQKYGGATVADPEKIRQVANRLAELSKSGTNVVAVVSAMGKTTNQLIELAHQVAAHPNRREMDMLLSTGERISMALMSIALNDLGCSAISFTGSQAGILTDDSHVAANVIDINAPRVKEALCKNKIVVLAGFQGVSPKTKEITTLGRGGSDITAIAMAAHLKAERCEILKDVESVFSADPKLVPSAKPIHTLTYPQLLDMTFWGAQFLNYKSVELAAKHHVPLYIGPADNKQAKGTNINTSSNAITLQKRSNQILAINSHTQVLKVKLASLHQNQTQTQALQNLNDLLEQNEIPFPQILKTLDHVIYITAPKEQIQAIVDVLKKQNSIQLLNENLASVTCSCIDETNEELQKQMQTSLKKNKIEIEEIQTNKTSQTVFISKEQRQHVIQILHDHIFHQ